MNKNFNFEEFIKPYESDAPKGDSRRTFYEYATNYLVSLNRPILVIETGTMWSSQGAFTMVFADLIKNWTGGKIITIDISEHHLNLSKENTKKYSDVIEYILSDSVGYLSSFEDKERIDLLYLDSYDLDVLDPIPSQIHHLRELLAVYGKLKSEVIIGVDDNLLPGCWLEWKLPNGQVQIFEAGNEIVGKGTLVDRFLRDQGWKSFNDWHQYSLLGYIKNN